MKILLRLLLLCLAGFVLVSNLHAQSYIVPNGVVTDLFPPEIDLNWPEETQVNGFLLTPVSARLSAYTNVFNFNEPATIGVRVFLVQTGQPVDLQTVSSQSYTELIQGNNYTFQNGTPVYVGMYSGANVAPPYPPTEPYNYEEPVFGWAELENIQGTAQLINSALEDHGGGIIVGTDTIIPVPEPSVWALIASGAGLLGVLRRRRKR